MKHLLLTLIALLPGTIALSVAHADDIPLAIAISSGNENSGVYIAHFNTHSGQITPPALAAPAASPTFMAMSRDQKFLYVASLKGMVAGKNGGGLSAFKVIDDGEKLEPLNARAQDGVVCHLTLDPSGKFLLAAAYTGGHVSAWRVSDDGSIGERTDLVKHQLIAAQQDEKPKEKSHVHQVIFASDPQKLLAVDLGLNQIRTYHLSADDGTLSPVAEPIIELADGTGPRHMAFHPSNHFAYTINERNSSITSFAVVDGTLMKFQNLSTLPDDFDKRNHPAEIAMHPSGRWLYVTNRGHDSIVSYAIDPETGLLTREAFTPSEGRSPWHMIFDSTGTWLLVANGDGRSVVVFRVDSEGGALTQAATLSDLPGNPYALMLLK